MRDVGKQRRTPSSLFAQGAQGQTAGQRLSARTKFASANSIFSLAVCFGRPRYRVFRYRNCPFMTANTCSTLARTDDFWCSAFFALLCPLADSFLICVGLQFCLYLIFCPACSERWHPAAFPPRYIRCLRIIHFVVQKRHAHLLVHAFIIAHYCPIFNAFVLRGGALIHRFALWAVTPFVRFSLQESYTTKERKCL